MKNIHRLLRLLRNGYNVLRHRHARILAYHSIAEVPADPWTISPAQLDAHLQILHHQSFQVCSLDELVQRLENKQDVSKQVCLTFDDAFRDFKDTALPILEAWNVPATVFVPVSKVGQYSDWSQYAPRRALMGWDELESVLDAGVTLGSHGLDHLRLTKVSSTLLQAEVEKSRDMLRRRLGINHLHFAYPYGASAQREQAAVQAAGYRSAVLFGGLWGNAASGNRWALTRESMMATLSENDFISILTGQRDWNELWNIIIQYAK